MKRARILPLLLTLILALGLVTPAMALDEEHDSAAGSSFDASRLTPPPVFMASQTTTVARVDGEEIQGTGTVDDPYVLEAGLEYVLRTSYSFGPRTPSDVEKVAAEQGYELTLSLSSVGSSVANTYLNPVLSTSTNNINISSSGCWVTSSDDQWLSLKLVADSHRVSLGQETDEFAADTGAKYSQYFTDASVHVQSDVSNCTGGTISFRFTTAIRPQNNLTSPVTPSTSVITPDSSSQSGRVTNDAAQNLDHDDGEGYDQKTPVSHRTAEDLDITNSSTPEFAHPTNLIIDQPLDFWDGVLITLSVVSLALSFTALRLVLKYSKPPHKHNEDPRDDS